MRYLSSGGIDYAITNGVPVIHEGYNGRVQQLSNWIAREIRDRARQLGAPGRPSAPPWEVTAGLGATSPGSGRNDVDHLEWIPRRARRRRRDLSCVDPLAQVGVRAAAVERIQARPSGRSIRPSGLPGISRNLAWFIRARSAPEGYPAERRQTAWVSGNGQGLGLGGSRPSPAGLRFGGCRNRGSTSAGVAIAESTSEVRLCRAICGSATVGCRCCATASRNVSWLRAAALGFDLHRSSRGLWDRGTPGSRSGDQALADGWLGRRPLARANAQIQQGSFEERLPIGWLVAQRGLSRSTTRARIENR